MNFIKSAPYTVVELALLWDTTQADVIRMAYAENILVQGLLREVTITTVKNNNKTNGLPPPEEFFKNLESDVKMISQWIFALHKYHMSQILLDGFADAAKFMDRNNNNIVIQAGGEPGKITPKDCVISGEHALQLVEKYDLHDRGDSKVVQTSQQGTRSGKTPQATKRENNLLKVIGGFIETIYLTDSRQNSRFRHGGKPNVKEIASAFLTKLTEAGFTDDGIKTRSLKDIISESLERINANKDF